MKQIGRPADDDPQDIEREARKREALDALAVYERQAPARRARRWDAIFRRTRDPLDALQALHEAAKAKVAVPEACAAWLADVVARRDAGVKSLSELLSTGDNIMRAGRRFTPAMAEALRSYFDEELRRAEADAKGLPRLRGAPSPRELAFESLSKMSGVAIATLKDIIDRQHTYRE